MKYIAIILPTIVAILEIIADILFKEWAIHAKKIPLFSGIILYVLATFAWAFSLKYQGLVRAVLIFGIITATVAILIGIFIYKEQASPLNILGIILGIISIILLEI